MGDSCLDQGDIPAFSHTDGLIYRFHDFFFVRHKTLGLSLSVAVYAAVVLAAGDFLQVSSNYFVMLPIIGAALCFGLPGGFVSGALGLPANLLLFWLLGHQEFSPASKPIAEASGVLIGLALGYLSDFYNKLVAEIVARKKAEKRLRELLAEKEILLHELNHRVKNNLNVVKSIVQLQASRSHDEAFKAACRTLISRILALALAQERLQESKSMQRVDMATYLRDLVTGLAKGSATERVKVEVRVEPEGFSLPAETAAPLGIIVNEVVTNSLKHAFKVGDRKGLLRIECLRGREDFSLSIRDNGPGFDPERDPKPESLGLKLVAALVTQLQGSCAFRPGAEGTRFELSARLPEGEALILPETGARADGPGPAREEPIA
jgi:two-component sensor histidine kinase